MDLLKDIQLNPFRVLNASPRDTREELIRKQEELALFGEDGASRQALTALLHPKTRLEAEIRWFPRTEPENIRRLLAHVEGFRDGQHLMYLPTDSVLARFHAIRLQMPLFHPETPEQLKAVLHALAAVADGLFPGQVTEEINADRIRSHFEKLKDANAEVSSLIRRLLQETVSFFMDGISANTTEWKSLSEQFKAEYRTRNSPYHNSYLIELASEEADLRK